jgi:hypothetical protein
MLSAILHRGLTYIILYYFNENYYFGIAETALGNHPGGTNGALPVAQPPDITDIMTPRARVLLETSRCFQWNFLATSRCDHKYWCSSKTRGTNDTVSPVSPSFWLLMVLCYSSCSERGLTIICSHLICYNLSVRQSARFLYLPPKRS